MRLYINILIQKGVISCVAEPKTGMGLSAAVIAVAVCIPNTNRGL